jgi:hypothetical protein
MTEAEQIMKRCQVGTRNYDEANNLHAACYGLIGKLSAQRTWVGLTDEEMFAALVQVDPLTKRLAPGFEYFARAIEAKLKEKNT